MLPPTWVVIQHFALNLIKRQQKREKSYRKARENGLAGMGATCIACSALEISCDCPAVSPARRVHNTRCAFHGSTNNPDLEGPSGTGTPLQRDDCFFKSPPPAISLNTFCPYGKVRRSVEAPRFGRCAPGQMATINTRLRGSCAYFCQQDRYLRREVDLVVPIPSPLGKLFFADQLAGR